MPKAERINREAQIVLQSRIVAGPDALVIHLEFSHHSKNETGQPCPHCGSEYAVETRRERLDSKLVEIETGEVDFRGSDPAWFDEAAEGVPECAIVIACTESTREHLTGYATDEDGNRRSSTTIFSGGIRSGKTSENAGAGAVDIFYLGGPGEQGWLGGPTIDKAHIFLKKLIEGEGSVPPILPHEMVVSYPKTDRATDQTAYLIDGTQLKFKHCRAVDEWQGEPPFMTRITEAGNVKDPKVLAEAEGRVTDRRGRTGFDSIPVMPSALHEVYQQGKRDIEENKERATTRVLEMSSAENPWQPPGEMVTKRARLAAVNPQQARRMYDGVWASNHSLLFEDVWDPTTHTFETYFQDHKKVQNALIEVGRAKIGRPLVDVTRAAAMRFFRKPHDWVIGADANYEPHTALVCKVVAFGPPDDQTKWGLFIWDEIRTWRANTYEAAGRLAEIGGGYLRGQGVSIDSSEDHDKKLPGAKRGSASGVHDYQSFGFNCRPCNLTENGKAKNPDVRISTNLVKHLMRDGLILVNRLQCQGLVRALNEQEDRGDGRPKDPTRSNTVTDREIYAFTDALRYLTYSLFRKIVERRLLGQHGPRVVVQ